MSYKNLFLRNKRTVSYDSIPFVKVTPTEERLISDICRQLYRQYPHALFTACVTEDGQWSLRSDKHGNNTDVGALAVALGGGGHRNASGFVRTEHPKNPFRKD